MKELAAEETLERAALKSGMSEVTARRYRKGATRKGSRPTRSYRTRVDPFERVWPEIAAMMEGAPGLEAKTILERLCERPDSEFHMGQLRTLQRRIRSWARATRTGEGSVLSARTSRGGVRTERLHVDERSEDHHRGRTVRASDLSLRVAALEVGDGDDLFFRDVRGADRGLPAVRGGVGAGPPSASHRQPLCGNTRPQRWAPSVQRALSRSDGALRGGSGSQHAGTSQRERLGRAGSPSFQASSRAGLAGAPYARLRRPGRI